MYSESQLTHIEGIDVRIDNPHDMLLFYQFVDALPVKE